MVKTVPKNYKCLTCGREQYFGEHCHLCGSTSFDRINTGDTNDVSVGDFVEYHGSRWIVIDSYENLCSVMNGYQEHHFNIYKNNVKLVAKGDVECDTDKEAMRDKIIEILAEHGIKATKGVKKPKDGQYSGIVGRERGKIYIDA